MARIKLFFDVTDTEFFERLGQYITSNYGMYFEITDNKEDPSVCVVSDYINRRNRRGVFLVKEYKGDIYKFSPASEICAELMSFAISDIPKRQVNKATARTICITSAAGGVGKSVIAKAICCRFSEKGKKVLYINFNPFSTHDGFFAEEKVNSLTRLRYSLRDNERNISAVIKSLVSRYAEKRIDFIVNKEPSGDGFISGEEAVLLMEELAGGTLYDVIVLDLSSYPDEGQVEIMRRASANLIVCKNRIDERHRSFRKYLEKNLVGRITEVLNFNDNGDLCIPFSKDIFTSHPKGFWKAIDRLCLDMEEKNEINN